MTPEGFEVGSHVGQRAKQHRNVARLNGYRLTVQKQRFFINDFILQPLGQCFSLCTAGLIRLPILLFPVCVFLRRRNEPELDPFMGKGIGFLRRGDERFVARLHAFDGIIRKQPGTTAVHRFEHLRVGAKVFLQGVTLTAGRQKMVLHDGIVGGNIRPSKRINGLLGISHDEQFPRLRLHVTPFFCFLSHGLSQKQNQFILHRIRVLKFIDQDRTILVLHFCADGRMVPKQVTCPGKQPAERHESVRRERRSALNDERIENLQHVQGRARPGRFHGLRNPDQPLCLFMIFLGPILCLSRRNRFLKNGGSGSFLECAALQRFLPQRHGGIKHLIDHQRAGVPFLQPSPSCRQVLQPRFNVRIDAVSHGFA